MSQRSPGILRRIFGGFWRLITWLRVATLNLLFLLLVVMVVVALWPKEQVQSTQQNMLVLAPTGNLVDQYTYMDPLTQLLEETQPEEVETLVTDLIQAIDLAAQDSDIEGLVLELDNLAGAGISKLEEVGAALTRFKATNKPIYAFGSNLTQQQYYLAAYADEVHLNPLGSLLVTGFASYRNYFKDAIDKLAINVHVFRAGEYKDALEPVMRNDMSDASKENNQLWLDELWGVYSSRVEELRDLPKGALNDYVNTMDKQMAAFGGDSARLAQDAGLVDRLTTRNQWQEFLALKFGQKPKDGVDHRAYLQVHKQHLLPSNSAKVAVITGRGTISQGDKAGGEIGDESFLAQLEQVHKDKSIKALVVRIDSGGGGVQASENIRQGLAHLAEARDIPIVISMGSVAASGGYWLATAADEIWATPTTITGSIGVFGAFPTLENSLDKLGIHTDGLSTTALAGAIRADRALSPMAEDILQLGVNHLYRIFLDIVAEARDTTPEAVDKIAQGRVWSGNTALELGLVDQLGNLEDVIDRAAELANLDDYEVKAITKPLSPLEQFVAELNSSQAVISAKALFSAPSNAQALLPAAFTTHLSKVLEPWALMDTLDDPRGLYVLCLECASP